jgi:hypothetical protein
MATARVSANVANATTYTPFGSSAFGSQVIGQLVDYNSQTTFGYLNTFGYQKILRIVFEYSFGSNSTTSSTPSVLPSVSLNHTNSIAHKNNSTDGGSLSFAGGNLGYDPDEYCTYGSTSGGCT